MSGDCEISKKMEKERQGLPCGGAAGGGYERRLPVGKINVNL